MTAEQRKGQAREVNAFEAAREYKCPDCGGPTSFMGLDFKAPKSSDIPGWKEAHRFIESGHVHYRRGDASREG